MVRWAVCAAVSALALGSAVATAPTALASAAKAPGPVSHVQAVNSTSSSLILTWRNPGAAHFADVVIRRATGSKAPGSAQAGTAVATVSRRTTKYAVTKLAPGTEYTFALFAGDGHGHYAHGASVHGLTGPAAVSKIRATVTDAGAALSWKNPTTKGFTGVTVRYMTGKTPPVTPTAGTGVKLKSAKATSATVAGLKPAFTYTFAVWAHDASGHYSTASAVRALIRPVPGPVTNATASVSGTAVSLTWTNPSSPDLSGVIIRRADGPTAPSGPTAGTAIGDVAATSFDDSSVSAGGTYTYALFAHDAHGHVAAGVDTSPVTIAGSDTTPPGPVTGVHVTAQTGSSLSLAWTDPTDPDLAGVTVVRKAGSTAPTSPTDGTVVADTSTTTLTDTVLAAGTTYTYALFAHDSVPNYAPADTITATTTTGPVTGVSATPSRTSVSLSWTNPTDPAFAGVMIRRASGATPPAGPTAGTEVVDTSGSTTNAVDSNLTSGTMYSYALFAHDASGHYAPSATISATTSTTVAAPAIVGTVTRGDTNAAVSGVTVTTHDDDTGQAGPSATTRSDGTYTITGVLASEDYTVCFDASQAAGAPATGFTKDCEYTTTDATNVSTVDEVLTVGGELTGKVGDSANTGLSGVHVLVYSIADNTLATSLGNAFGTISTGSDGTYQVKGVPASTQGYALCFDAAAATGGASATGYQDECYNDVAWTAGESLPSNATAVPLASGATKTANATLSSGGGISGTVTSGGTGLSGVKVYTFAIADGGLATQEGNAVTTGSDGTYAVSGLANVTGGYGVCFDARKATGGSSTTGYQSQCYSGVPWDAANDPDSVTAVSTTAGSFTKSINVSLASGATISGTVTAASGGADLADVQVQLFDAHGTFVRQAMTSSSGSYSFSGLQPSTPGYSVCFDGSEATGGPSSSGYTDQCYQGVAWDGESGVPVAANPVAIAANATKSNINVALAVPGASGGISGTVTAATGGAPLANVEVTASGSDGFTETTTAANGTYSLPRASAGNLCFYGTDATGGSSSAGYLQQCTTVSSTPATKNVALASAVGISGTITSAASGHPAVVGANVEILDPSQGYVDSMYTSSTGQYSVVGLPPSSTGYDVCVDTNGATGTGATGFADACYPSASWNGDQNSPASGSTAVAVAAGSVTSGINLSLQPGAAISGKVTGAGTTPIEGVSVYAITASHDTAASAVTGTDGTYVLTDLAGSTSYTVCFYGSSLGSGNGYLDQCYNGAAWNGSYGSLPAGATTVAPTAGSTTPNINAALPSAGGISGTVTAASGGAPVSGARVYAFAPGGDDYVTSTAGDGTYTVPALPPGSGYTVCFAPDNYDVPAGSPGLADQCYQNIAWDGSHTTLPSGTTGVTVGNTTTTGINGALPVAGSISGVVTSATNSNDLRNVQVEVFNSTGVQLDSTNTDGLGRYSVAGLTPSSTGYTLCFDASAARGAGSAPGYLSQCYNGVAWPGVANGSPPAGITAVPVTSGSATVRNASITSAGGVSGTVSAGGNGLRGARVTAYTGTTPVSSTVSLGDGTYLLGGLSTGSYTVCFDVSNVAGGTSTTGYLDQCYNAVAWDGNDGDASGTAVSVTNAAVTANITAAITSAGAVAGTITSAGTPLSGVDVDVISSAGLVFGATTGADGTYRVDSIKAGQYHVCADPSSVSGGPSAGGYADTCYQSAAWGGDPSSVPSGATAVTVAAGSAASVSFAVPQLAGVHGTVTDATDGSDVSFVDVDIITTAGAFVAETETADDGTWAVTGLTSGSYDVCFAADGASGTSAAGYKDQCYSGQAWDGDSSSPASGATAVSLTAGTSKAGVDAALVRGAAIGGTVSGSNGGGALADVDIQLFDSTRAPVGETFSDQDGSYSFAGLTAGSYYVCMNAYSNPSGTASYGGQCFQSAAYDGTSVPSAATAITVTAGNVSSANVTMPLDAAIAGTVTDDQADPLADTAIDVYTSSRTLVTSTVSDFDGTYQVVVPPSTTGYYVCFDASGADGGDNDGNYADQCYQAQAWDGSASGVTGTLVPATAGAVSSGKDAAIQPAA